MFVAITLSLFTFPIEEGFGEETGTVEIQIRDQMVLVEGVDEGGVVLRNVGVAEVFAHGGGVFALNQGIVVGVAGTRLGELNEQLVEECCDLVIDILRTVIFVSTADHEREGIEQCRKRRNQIRLADALYTRHHLKLGHRVHGIDVINAFTSIQVALMHRIDGL